MGSHSSLICGANATAVLHDQRYAKRWGTGGSMLRVAVCLALITGGWAIDASPAPTVQIRTIAKTITELKSRTCNSTTAPMSRMNSAPTGKLAGRSTLAARHTIATRRAETCRSMLDRLGQTFRHLTGSPTEYPVKRAWL